MSPNLVSETVMNRLTDNEVNNLIYALIKYGFGKLVPSIQSPPNALIKDIMLVVQEEGVNIPTIIMTTMRIVETQYNVYLSDRDFQRLKEYCYQISVAVMQQPFELRNNLGKDAESEEFVTKH